MDGKVAKDKLKILILDAQNQNTLAIVRHLGSRHEIDVVGSKQNTLSFFSKYVSKKIILPDPKKNPLDFVQGLLKTLTLIHYDLLMPVGFRSYQLCAQYQDEIKRHTKLILTSAENINLASDKNATYRLAKKTGVPFPETYDIRKPEDFDTQLLNFPIVIKYPFESGKNVVEYAADNSSAKKIFSGMLSMNEGKAVIPIVQEYVTGDGYGFFAFYEDGICRRTFMHHRIREYPVTGGASVCAESFEDEALASAGRKLLDHLKWNGVAMVEFKKDNRDNSYKLMEINPKFWGSLELAICSGVDFPSMLCDTAGGKAFAAESQFRKVTFQWLLNGELFHFLERPSSLLNIIRTLRYSKTDFQWDDIRPNLFQFVNIFVHYYKKMSGKK